MTTTPKDGGLLPPDKHVCEICGANPRLDPDVALFRANAKGQAPIWRCSEHRELPGMLELQLAVAKGQWPHTMDAQVWASEFQKRFPVAADNVPDEADLIGWFANAIMAGYDTANQRRAAQPAGREQEFAAQIEEALFHKHTGQPGSDAAGMVSTEALNWLNDIASAPPQGEQTLIVEDIPVQKVGGKLIAQPAYAETPASPPPQATPSDQCEHGVIRSGWCGECAEPQPTVGAVSVEVEKALERLAAWADLENDRDILGNVQFVIAALQRIAPAAPSQWRPIESAPMREEILLLLGTNYCAVGFQESTGTCCEWSAGGGASGELLNGEPTHWQPLPEPPDSDKEKQK